MSYRQKTRHILVVESSQTRQTFELLEQTYCLGRQPSNGIVIDSQNISRKHATLIQRQDPKTQKYSYWILDGSLQGIKSYNGIFINGQRCYTKELKDGDVINFGCEVNAVYHALNVDTNNNNFKDTSSSELGVDLKDINKRTTFLLSKQINKFYEPEFFATKPDDIDKKLVENFDIFIKNSQLSKTEIALKQALDENQFSLYYQPQYNIKTRKIYSLEALLRWQHPKKGLMLPHQFISSAEKTELIIPIGQWVLETACQQILIWQQLGLPLLSISANLSSRQFCDPSLKNIINQVLNKTGIMPKLLELEISEKTIMKNENLAEQIFQNLQSSGVQFSMDDFGTGSASLSYLQKFPFHTLKIAQTFMKNFTNKPQDFALLSAVIAWGSITKLNIVAEGVETEEQLELLRRLNIEKVQGYLISAPLTLPEATKFLFLHFSEVA